MHELSLTMNIFAIIRERCEQNFGKMLTIKKVRVVIGKIANVVPSALSFCFEMAGKNTPFENALLEIKEVPLRIRCHDCHEEMDLDEPFFFCRKCDSFNLTVLSGKELYVDTFEVDTPEPHEKSI